MASSLPVPELGLLRAGGKARFGRLGPASLCFVAQFDWHGVGELFLGSLLASVPTDAFEVVDELLTLVLLWRILHRGCPHIAVRVLESADARPSRNGVSS